MSRNKGTEELHAYYCVILLYSNLNLTSNNMCYELN